MNQINKITILLLLVVVVVVSSWIFNYSSYQMNNNKNDKKAIIHTLLRQSARWSVAADQDESPIIALLHANYGAAYLWALKDIASDTEIEESEDINILEFAKRITDIQDTATRKVSQLCPQFTGKMDEYLLKLGGDM